MPCGEEFDGWDVVASRSNVALRSVVRRNQIDPGEPARIRDGAPAVQSQVVHAAQHTAISRLGAATRHADELGRQSLGGQLLDDAWHQERTNRMQLRDTDIGNECREERTALAPRPLDRQTADRIHTIPFGFGLRLVLGWLIALLHQPVDPATYSCAPVCRY